MRKVLFAWVGLLVLLSAAISKPVYAEFDFGAGMEFFTFKSTLDALDGTYYHTVLKTTLATAELTFVQKDWFVTLNAGVSDWNVSGEWQYSGSDAVTTDPFFWAWQNTFAIEGQYRVWGPLRLGLNYSSRALEHYEGRSHYRFLEMQTQALSGILSYDFLTGTDLQANLAVLYTPRMTTSFYQNIYFIENDILIGAEDTHGKGQYWQGRIKMEYRDSAGWGLDLIYQFGWFSSTTMQDVSRLDIRSGSLTGYLLLRF